jgi:hypothetical protein
MASSVMRPIEIRHSQVSRYATLQAVGSTHEELACKVLDAMNLDSKEHRKEQDFDNRRNYSTIN